MHVRYSWMESKDGNPWSSQSHQLRLHFALPKRAILFSPWVRKHQNVQNNVLFFFFVWDHPMHMGQGSLTILDGQFRLHQNHAIILQFLHRFDIFGWKMHSMQMLCGDKQCLSDKMTKNNKNSWGHVIQTMAFIANNDNFTRCWLFHLESMHNIPQIMQKYIWKLCLVSRRYQPYDRYC